jgi:deoxycytidylate deaminase
VKNERISLAEPLKWQQYPELVFGLIGPCGTDLPSVMDVLTSELRSMGYNVVPITLSRLIEAAAKTKVTYRNEYDRIKHLMSEGTSFRSRAGLGDAVARLAIAEMRRQRPKSGNSVEHSHAKTAFILKSLKHPDEVALLRHVYGQGCFMISAYAPREERLSTLATRIERSLHEGGNRSRTLAEELIALDESEFGERLGQDVEDAFPLADLFLDARSKGSVQKNLKRFVELIFGHPFHTPTTDEYGMFHAKSAAMRSADLNRQVGASIKSADFDLIAMGCNDVPKAGGGLYWPHDDHDARDFKTGRDSMYIQRENILRQIVSRFKTAGLLSESALGEPDLANSLLSGDLADTMKGTQVMNLLEFGRSVHAEMAALMNAARRGVSVSGATLFVTTFPCHVCARHIVASGISRVKYIEPYPKSRAKTLHGDSITIDASHPTSAKVSFEPFIGIAPRLYMHIFEAHETRKHADGSAIDWLKEDKKPRVRRFLSSYHKLETWIVASLECFVDVEQNAANRPNVATSLQGNENHGT